MSKALEIAEERFAKGEINKEELDEIRRELTSNSEKSEQVRAQKEPATTTPDAQENVSSFNILKYWWVAVILVLYLGYASIKNDLVIESLSSDSPLFGATTVSAVVYNKGSPREYSYHVLKGASKTKHCKGGFFIGKNERRSLKFQCHALTGYTGKFSLITTTK